MRTGSIASIVAGCVLATCVLTTAASAQECGSVSTPEDLAAFLANLNAGVYAPQPAPETPSHVAVTFHVVRRSSGLGGINEAQLVRAIDGANLHFVNAGIGFCWNSAIDYIDDDDLVDIGSVAELDQLRSMNVVPGTINIYTVRSITFGTTGIAGVSSFTWSPVQGIVMAEDYMGQPNARTTFSHELGHYFDLWHTHEDHGGTLPECVACCNCNIAGDFLCDTPADPNLGQAGMLSGCTYVGTVLDPCNNDPYQPDVANLMSYSFECRSFFSNQQNFRMRATLDRLRSDHLVVCPGQNVWRLDGKFLALDGAANDSFGRSVSLSGDRALVGTPYDDDLGTDSGSAYVFDKVGGVWVQTAKILAPDGAADDEFGFSVSLSGDRALVGAHGDAAAAGSAYVFERVGRVWVQTAKLVPNDPAWRSHFGYSVSLSGDRALVGRPGSGQMGAGSAYVFDNVGGVWVQATKLLASNGSSFDSFGVSVSLSGDRALVGAHGDDDLGGDSGAAYIFDKVAGAWSQTAKLLASNGSSFDSFGVSVSLSSDRALVGAIHGDGTMLGSGSTYVFDKVGGAWSQTTMLLHINGAPGDSFGSSVSLSGDRALVGATNAGGAFVFDKVAGTWRQTVKLLAPDYPVGGDRFGNSVSLSGDRALVGAYGDDGRWTNAGSAYAFADLSHLRFCYPDCDSNGVLDIFDFLCFQNSFVAGEPYACDCDPDPVCDIFDFLCFQTAFVAGCP